MKKYIIIILIAVVLTFASLLITTKSTYIYGNECYEINRIDNLCHYAVKAKGYPLGMIGEFEGKPVPNSAKNINSFEGIVINLLFYLGITGLLAVVISEFKSKFRSHNSV